LGVGAGDRVVVQLANGWPFVVLVLACLRAGVVPVMALPGHRRTELAYLVEHAEAVAIAVPDVLRDCDHQGLAAELVAGSPTLVHVLVDGAGRRGARRPGRTVHAPRRRSGRRPRSAGTPRRPARATSRCSLLSRRHHRPATS
jgi:2,3-dihydroxybenzoate-AMP ligase